MIKGEKEQLDDYAKNYTCKDDDGMLTVAWHAGENAYVLRCQHGHFPEEITRQKSLTEEYKSGEELPEPIKRNVEKGIAKRARETTKQPVARTLGGVPATDLGTRELLTLDQVHDLVAYAKKYDLDPYRDHVYVMYGKPYIGLDGYLFHANRSGVKYQMASHPLSDDERRLYQVPSDDHAWISTISIGGGESTFTGLGIVTKDEMTARSSRDEKKLRSPVVAAYPWHLAQKRAEWQVLRRAFPIGESEEEEHEAGDES